MIIFSNSQACLIYIKEKKSLYLVVEGFLDSITLQSLFKKTKLFCNELKVKSILFDSSKLEIFKNDDINWIKQLLFNQVDHVNLKKIAFLKPESIFGELSIQKLMLENKLSATRQFESIEAAENWAFAC